MSATMTRSNTDPTEQSVRTVSIELELELDYVGLSDQQIRDRCLQDQESIIEAIDRRESPVLPYCLRGFRFVNYGNGAWFPQNPGPNTSGS